MIFIHSKKVQILSMVDHGYFNTYPPAGMMLSFPTGQPGALQPLKFKDFGDSGRGQRNGTKVDALNADESMVQHMSEMFSVTSTELDRLLEKRSPMQLRHLHFS